MPEELEQKIAAWRARMRAALPGQEETVRELESHLRDHLELRLRAGIAPEEALAESERRLGDVHGIAREFARVRSPWWPKSWALRGILVLMLATGVALLVAIDREFSARAMTPLLAAHVLAITSGYLIVFCTGLIGCSAIVRAWHHPLKTSERREHRDMIFRLSCTSCVLVPIGIGLGMIWAAENLGAAWSWQRTEVGAFFVCVSAVLLLVTQLRVRMSDHFRFLLAVLGGTAVAFGMIGAKGLTPAVPIAWLWLAFAASQAAVVLLRSKPAGAEA